MSELKSTPERLDTTQTDQIMIEHLHRYALAVKFVKNKRVLDIASGEGYGASLLADVADFVYGVDLSAEAVAHAQKKYKKENLSYQQGSAAKIPLEDHCVDMITSFETIEHHDQHDAMMLECKRVLRPGGLLIISSPDKKYYSDLTHYRNPYHTKELYEEEFKRLIRTYFQYSKFLNQKYLTASVILTEDGPGTFKQYGGSYERLLPEENFTLVYNIAFASDSELPYPDSSFFPHEADTLELTRSTRELYENSTTWKIGRAVIAPLALIKSLFSNDKI